MAIESDAIASQLFRIAQEATNNAIKHANAKRIRIEFKEDANNVILSIVDDGKGFEPDYQSSGMGLRIMRYRARMIGAGLEVSTSDPSKSLGTSVTVKLKRE